MIRLLKKLGDLKNSIDWVGSEDQVIWGSSSLN